MNGKNCIFISALETMFAININKNPDEWKEGKSKIDLQSFLGKHVSRVISWALVQFWFSLARINLALRYCLMAPEIERIR